MQFHSFVPRISYRHIYIHIDIHTYSHQTQHKWQCTHLRHQHSVVIWYDPLLRVDIVHITSLYRAEVYTSDAYFVLSSELASSS